MDHRQTKADWKSAVTKHGQQSATVALVLRRAGLSVDSWDFKDMVIL